jgi:hypothetical protein
MKVVFSSLFKRDLTEAETKYALMSSRLADDFHARVKENIRAIARWHGGDHIGPHGYPCKHCRPFPYLLYYEITGDTLYVIGIVHERRHPSYLKREGD